MSVGCHVTTIYSTHFGKCVPIVRKKWNEHSGRMGGHPWVWQGKPKEFSNTIRPPIMRSTNQGWTTQGQGDQLDSSGGSTSYSMKQGGKDKC